MTPIEINPKMFLAPEGTHAVTYTAPESMPDCLPLPTLVTPDGRVAMAWMPDENDLMLLAQGAPVTIVLWSGGEVRPLSVAVGGQDLRPDSVVRTP